ACLAFIRIGHIGNPAPRGEWTYLSGCRGRAPRRTRASFVPRGGPGHRAFHGGPACRSDGRGAIMPGFGTAGRTPPPHVGAAGGASSLATRRPSTARAGAADERHVSRPYAGPGDRPPRLSNRRG